MSSPSRKLRSEHLKARIYAIRDQRQTEEEIRSGLFRAGNVRPRLLQIMKEVVIEQERQKAGTSGSAGGDQV